MVDKRDIDDVTGTHTTGHEWDGIKELDTPLPKWWLWIFYASIVFAFLYVIAYPAIPLVNSSTKGLLGYSSRATVAEAVAEHAQGQAEWRQKLASTSLTDIGSDAQLAQFATKAGAASFGVNCSQCHGTGAQGFPGYPNLNDDAWLWGGSLDEIYHTIKHGVRNEDSDDARYSEMPAFDELLTKEELRDVTQHVLKLGNLEYEAEAANRGAGLFGENCSACHGENGGGDQEQGAPRLSDAIWLFGSDGQQIASQIANPAHGVMPAWGNRVDDATVKALAIYVHGLGGGQ